MEERKKGARNPKTVKFTISVDDTINERLNRVADVAGQNKTTMAAFVLAAGLRAVEHLLLPNSPEEIAEVARRLAQDTGRDVQQVADASVQVASDQVE